MAAGVFNSKFEIRVFTLLLVWQRSKDKTIRQVARLAAR